MLNVWESLPKRFPRILLDAFVVMPNHIHGIVFLGGTPIDNLDDLVDTTTPSVASPFVAIGASEQNESQTPRTPSVASPFMATDALAMNVPRTLAPSGETVAINGDATKSAAVRGRRPPVPPVRDQAMPALGEIVRSLKAASTTRIRKEIDPQFAWQEGYWDRIIRNDAELERYRAYIENNPARWEEDREYLKGDW